MEANNFFFYDLETSGLNAREDRIMQFAGQRTTLDLEPMGEPVNILVKMTDDAMVVETFTDAKIHLVEGSYENIKITTPEDLRIAEALLK